MAQSAGQQEAGLMQVSNLREFFRDSVDDAMESNRLAADDHTAHYVVNLLTLFASAETFNEAATGPDGPRPLALMLADAVEAPTSELRHSGLQKLGDVTLFLAGFFADDLHDSVVDIDYYIFMGGSAYSSLSAEVRGTRHGNVFGGVFAELGAKFSDFVDVLNDVRGQSAHASDTDLLRQYDVWRKTGSARARRLLEEQNIYPFPPAPAGQRH